MLWCYEWSPTYADDEPCDRFNTHATTTTIYNRHGLEIDQYTDATETTCDIHDGEVADLTDLDWGRMHDQTMRDNDFTRCPNCLQWIDVGETCCVTPLSYATARDLWTV